MAGCAALRLLLAGLCLVPSGAAEAGPPRSPPPLPCALLEAGGGRGALPGAVTQRPAVLRLVGGRRGDPPEPGVDPNVTFDVSDPWGPLERIWGPPWVPPTCELSPTPPHSGSAPWARALHPDGRSPPEMGGSWWLASLGTPSYGVTALLQGQPGPPGATAVTAALAVLTRTPEVRGRPGGAVELHCAFAAPPGPFALEWRHQHQGAGRVLLAYDSATARAPRATPGAELLLGAPGGDGDGATAVTLRLPRLDVAHEGTYFCSVFLPHGHAQQLLQLHVLEPPKVTLSPRPLVVAPGAAAELRCHVSGFYPLDVAVTWTRRAAGSGTSAPAGAAVAETWSSGHRQGPNGTYSRSVGARLVPAQPQHHGDVYACVVTHPALSAPLRATVRLRLAGSEGPALEDALGLFLVAFVLCGLVRWLSPAPPRPEDHPKKSQ